MMIGMRDHVVLSNQSTQQFAYYHMYTPHFIRTSKSEAQIGSSNFEVFKFFYLDMGKLDIRQDTR